MGSIFRKSNSRASAAASPETNCSRQPVLKSTEWMLNLSKPFYWVNKSIRMRLTILCVLMVRLSGNAQVIFSGGGDAKSLMYPPQAGAVRPDLVLAVPGEYYWRDGVPGDG